MPQKKPPVKASPKKPVAAAKPAPSAKPVLSKAAPPPKLLATVSAKEATAGKKLPAATAAKTPALKTSKNDSPAVILEKLAELGKKKGFLTFEEVNNALPKEMTNPDQLEDAIAFLGQKKIEIVESEDDAPATSKKAKAGPSEADLANEEEEEAPAPEVVADDSDELLKANDPVRLYLRKMGSIPLLTKDGEVEIAKLIEEGESEVMEVVLNS